MLANAVRRRLRRPVALIAAALAAVAASVFLTAAPAHAAYIYQGTFLIQDFNGFCLQALSRDNRGPIVLSSCTQSADRLWRIYQLTDNYDYQIQPFDGEWPLNKCMDAPDSYVNVWTYGCHGQHQQRWTLNPGTSFPQQIKQTGRNVCLSERPPLGAGYIITVKQACTGSFPAPSWRLVRV
jgi:hypothetical protein